MFSSLKVIFLLLISSALFANQGYPGISVQRDAVLPLEGFRIVNVFDDGAA